MDAIEMIKGRRSIRKFEEKVVDQKIIEEIMEVSRYYPSWTNLQVVRYNFITDEKIIKDIATNGVNDFIYNEKTLINAKNLLVLSYIEGKSGKLDKEKYNLDEDYDSGTNDWEIFDSGIACQTFCLAAYEKGLGSVIMGVINNENIAEIINLPKDEKVATIIVFGYPVDKDIKAPVRKSVEEITRFYK